MRTHYCGKIGTPLLGQTVTLCGWAHRPRDHGGVIFIDLHDREGLAQVVCRPGNAEVFSVAEQVRNQFVLSVTGEVRRRLEGTVNPKLPTGEVEVEVERLEILNPSAPPPFQLDEGNLSETVRLENRVLDLRRESMRRNLMLRHRAAMAARRFLDGEGFVDIETPFLYKSTPEGAREFLVPSRLYDGHFYALPQSPQLFKQMLMIAGFDRYYQIVKCFRDEDLRADRQPEFTQIDIETSFLDEQEIRLLMERLTRSMFKEAAGIDLVDSFPVMKYEQAMRDYGVDKPDLRIDLKLVDVADVMKNVDFKVFSGPANMAGGRVAALHVPRGGELLSRSQIDAYTRDVAAFGAKGLAYIKINDISQAIDGAAKPWRPFETLSEADKVAILGGVQSPITKFLTREAVGEVLYRTKATSGDLIFFGADKEAIVNSALGALRQKVAADLNLVKAGWRPLWVVDFPMFELDEETKEWKARHHPFTSPKDGHEKYIESDPGQAYAKAYDLVLNGWEIAGGSVRIHRQEIQERVFAALRISHEDQRAKFGFLLDALQYGAPPHGGIAFGFDRLVTLMAGAEAIRDVIAFPKTQRGQDLLTGAPTQVTEKQLRELHLRLRNPQQS